MSGWVWNPRRNQTYIMYFWKHGYHVSYHWNNSSKQLFTDNSLEPQNWMNVSDGGIPANEAQYLGFGNDSAWKYYYKQDDILLFYPHNMTMHYDRLDKNKKKRMHIDLGREERFARHRGGEATYNKWINSFTKPVAMELAYNITKNDQYNKNK